MKVEKDSLIFDLREHPAPSIQTNVRYLVHGTMKIQLR